MNKDQEALEDLLDWARRWQAERRRNTAEKDRTPESRMGNFLARVILRTSDMNAELDAILAAYDEAVSAPLLRDVRDGR